MLAAQEDNAHNTLLSHFNRNGRTRKTKEGHHHIKTEKSTDALLDTKVPWIVKRSRQTRKDAPAPLHTKTMDALEHTAKKRHQRQHHDT